MKFNYLKFFLILSFVMYMPFIVFSGCEDGDCENGYGTYIWRDGDTDSSSWIVGDKYIGSFKNGKMHGQGKHISTNGEIYIGSYLFGLRSGYGFLTYTDGSSYTGFFKNDLLHGKGIFIDKKGESKKALFSNNKIIKTNLDD
tara:strand:+ start:1508 stop:1933 length:426 start_codon:yes stop_codon:yes gene_type:complete